LEASGFTVYCTGQFVAAPALASRSEPATVEAVTPDTHAEESLQPFEVDLLKDHAKYGCISLTCKASNRRHPFVFLPLRGRRQIPKAHLVYCRDLEDFVLFAGPLGRYLVRRGFAAVAIDSNGAIRGLVGRYYEDRKYFKGPDRPRLGDIAYSERVIFNF
jgi:hypothetical protein